MQCAGEVIIQHNHLCVISIVIIVACFKPNQDCHDLQMMNRFCILSTDDRPKKPLWRFPLESLLPYLIMIMFMDSKIALENQTMYQNNSLACSNHQQYLDCCCYCCDGQCGGGGYADPKLLCDCDVEVW